MTDSTQPPSDENPLVTEYQLRGRIALLEAENARLLGLVDSTVNEASMARHAAEMELEDVIDTIQDTVGGVIVAEGGGPPNAAASVAVTLSKFKHSRDEAEARLALLATERDALAAELAAERAGSPALKAQVALLQKQLEEVEVNSEVAVNACRSFKLWADCGAERISEKDSLWEMLCNDMADVLYRTGKH